MIDLLHELLHEVRDDQKEMCDIVRNIEHDTKRNTEDLIKHIENNVVLKNLHVSNEARIRKIENIGLTLINIGKSVIFVGTISGSIYGIIRLVEHFNV